MRPFLAFIALIFPIVASGDQITATLVDQKLSTSANSSSGASSNCSNSGTASTSCASTGPDGGAFGSASISGAGGGIQLGASAYGFGSGYLVVGSASATLNGTVSITGGTGYLLVDVFSSGTGPSYSSTAKLNGQNGIPLNGWESVPFTFGQDVDYSFFTRAQAGDDSSGGSSLTISDIRVYGYRPTHCAGQSCTDCLERAHICPRCSSRLIRAVRMAAIRRPLVVSVLAVATGSKHLICIPQAA